MIKKTTKAVFRSGGYAGEYDWEGGIPLFEGELITVTTSSGEQIVYRMVDKAVTLSDQGEDQFVHIEYAFDVSA